MYYSLSLNQCSLSLQSFWPFQAVDCMNTTLTDLECGVFVSVNLNIAMRTIEKSLMFLHRYSVLAYMAILACLVLVNEKNRADFANCDDKILARHGSI